MPVRLHRSQSSQSNGSHKGFGGFIHGITHSRTGSPDPKAPMISSAKLIDEENNPKYNAQNFYPMRLGERLNDRYEVVAKLGYGMTATVWLARDTQASPSPGSRKYVSIKVNVNTMTTDFLNGRRDIARTLLQGNKSHPGYLHVRFMIETFSLKTKHGEHLCIVYDVLREPLDECMQKLPNRLFSSSQLRKLLPALLKGLDYMHTDCHIVHTDLKADNIMIGLGDDPNGVLDKFVTHLTLVPPARKPQEKEDHRIIYQSSSDLHLVGNKQDSYNLTDAEIATAKITDMGLAEFADRGNLTHPIQSNVFTCPEVLLGIPWSYPADIWNLGVMLWDFFETQGLFDCIECKPGRYHGDDHLAAMIALLGPPPKELLDRAMKASRYFDYDREKEEWIFKQAKLVQKYDMSWDNMVTHMRGPNKESFVDLAKKMICWDPRERWTAAQLLAHPWLREKPGTMTCMPLDFTVAHRTLSQSDARDAEARASIAGSLAASPAASDIFKLPGTSYFDFKNGTLTPPEQGIVHRSTSQSFISMQSIKEDLPSQSPPRSTPAN
ncbi:hypothetical protein LTR66_015853 [Elasticomyces elasticus]|nr:hypothetical protein LTR66_015853 [Elasticomyces elasticus]